MAGPTIGSAFDLVGKLGVENVYEAAKGKDTHAGAEALRFARGHLPYVNLWYAKARSTMPACTRFRRICRPAISRACVSVRRRTGIKTIGGGRAPAPLSVPPTLALHSVSEFRAYFPYVSRAKSGYLLRIQKRRAMTCCE
ncbi:hypothetical protein AWV80_01125 [Cupriavidus sp. UYMU48A]|nr:hypothetical protein AWV80_01125 [Cupriavidus sp. UYMU48A]